jgi:hypothetical protein
VLVKAMFEKLMRAAQAKHTLILQHNKVFAQLAESELQTQSEKTIQI